MVDPDIHWALLCAACYIPEIVDHIYIYVKYHMLYVAFWARAVCMPLRGTGQCGGGVAGQGALPFSKEFPWSAWNGPLKRSGSMGRCLGSLFPDPWEDPKSRSTLRFHNLQHRSTRVQNWGIYFLEDPRVWV